MNVAFGLRFQLVDATPALNRSHKRPFTVILAECPLPGGVVKPGIEWGAMEFNPLRGMRKLKRPPRRRYVSDDEYDAVYKLASPMIQCDMDLALLTGLRRGDILGLTRSNLSSDGLVVVTNKTGAGLLFEWTGDLRTTIRKARMLMPQVRPWIVCNRKGKQFTKNGFDSVWNRLMARAVENGVERFQFRDLRRKSATDEADEKVAQERLGHRRPEIPARVYRVKPKRVKPLR